MGLERLTQTNLTWVRTIGPTFRRHRAISRISQARARFQSRITVRGEVFSTAVLAVNTWTHLALTFDGSTLRLYVNGVLNNSKAVTGTLPTSSNPLQIGGNAIYGDHFAGKIDEIRVYNTALTQAQIQTDINTPLP